MRIGFIGLGNMGSGMAANLHRYCRENDIQFNVLDLNKDAMQPFIDNGARGAGSIAELASHSDVVFSSLPSSKQVNAIAMGEAGLLANLPSGATWFETSTSDLSEWQKVRQAAPSHLTLIDAPVTGGTEGAAAGTLTTVSYTHLTLPTIPLV